MTAKDIFDDIPCLTTVGYMTPSNENCAGNQLLKQLWSSTPGILGVWPQKKTYLGPAPAVTLDSRDQLPSSALAFCCLFVHLPLSPYRVAHSGSPSNGHIATLGRWASNAIQATGARQRRSCAR